MSILEDAIYPRKGWSIGVWKTILVLVASILCKAALVTMGVKEDDVENIPSIKSIEDKIVANLRNNIEEFSKKYL